MTADGWKALASAASQTVRRVFREQTYRLDESIETVASQIRTETKAYRWKETSCTSRSRSTGGAEYVALSIPGTRSTRVYVGIHRLPTPRPLARPSGHPLAKRMSLSACSRRSSVF